jgi:hypothetical protein
MAQASANVSVYVPAAVANTARFVGYLSNRRARGNSSGQPSFRSRTSTVGSSMSSGPAPSVVPGIRAMIVDGDHLRNPRHGSPACQRGRPRGSRTRSSLTRQRNRASVFGAFRWDVEADSTARRTLPESADRHSLESRLPIIPACKPR